MIRIIAAFFIAFFMLVLPVSAQSSFQDVAQSHFPNIKRGSVKTAPPVIADIQSYGGDVASRFLQNWQSKNIWYRKSDERLVTVQQLENKSYRLFDLETEQAIGEAAKSDIKQVKPNSGLRGLLGSALVASQLISDDLSVRKASLDNLTRNPKPNHMEPLRTAIAKEKNADLKSRMSRLERLLTMQFDTNTQVRVKAIESFTDDLGLDVRARLNPMLNATLKVSQTEPTDQNMARIITPSETGELPIDKAYSMIVSQGWAPASVSKDAKQKALVEHIQESKVGGILVSDLNTLANRETAYTKLADAGLAPQNVSEVQIQEALSKVYFYEVYTEQSPEVVKAAKTTLDSINKKVAFSQAIDLFLDGLSLASIFFLAAIGLAITFGVMRVINMAHGEFIMMGAYTGYVVQQFVTNYTLSIIIAIPAAFMVTFAAGVAMERLVIRHLYHRPLETLLATFGVSIALQQLAKNIFGTQARPLTSPDWLGGAWEINDVISISWIRVAIFGLSILFFLMLWFTLNKTRLGLETRAVTQNPRMAASMGINPDKINMLTFGLGSGIAGIAGIAIGLFAKVTSELGSDYIVQSFMTVVVGGVGNIWGTLAGATMIGFLQKGIEWFNPSNTLAAQTFMIIFIIIFIQFRPRGIIALKGRAAGD